ncbi:MAG: type II toxin-antitoxin system HicA family toxin [Sandaracinaceae bacterium]|nr:type II toxin-antitoxin system HicA family toxin [Sandaracinaceae bacterium]
MKRRELIKRLTSLGATFVHEGGKHTVYRNPSTGMLLAVPRHTEIGDGLAQRLLRDAARKS